MQYTCGNSWCKQAYDVTKDDLAFYEKVSPEFGGKKYLIPPPTLCPDCRQRRRFAFRNEHTLHRAICGATGKKILSMYRNTVPFPVYEHAAWWGGSWDGLTFGRDVSLDRSFLGQWHELRQVVPHLNLCNDSTNVNCDYVNQTSSLKDCYLAYDSDSSERLYYCSRGKFSLSCIDCLSFFHCELCYDCIDCYRCYGVQHARDSENCIDSFFLRDCKNCKHCIGCVNLRGKEHCIFNEQLTPEDYASRLAAYRLDTHSGRIALQEQFDEWQKQLPVKAVQHEHVENGTGDHLRHVKDVKHCFDCDDAQDCSYCTNVSHTAKDCMDYDVWGFQSELCYESITVGERAVRCAFCVDCWAGVSDMYYCDLCVHSSNLFGCVGLRKNTYCILNKQYTKEEYHALVPKIVERMKTDREWGEFPPMTLSPFPYNETNAQDYHPLTEDTVGTIGMTWAPLETVETSTAEDVNVLPDSIHDAPDTVVSRPFRCAQTGRPFRIIDQELSFHRTHSIPLPRVHPSERLARNMARRHPCKLWDRECAKCHKPIATTFAPERHEIVYCEECYLKEVY